MWVITAAFRNQMTSVRTYLKLFPSSSQPNSFQVPTGMTGDSSLQPLGLWLKAPGWHFPRPCQECLKRYMELIYGFCKQRLGRMHFKQLMCRAHIDDAHPVCFILPAVPDIALSDNESHTFKQSSMPQI